MDRQKSDIFALDKSVNSGMEILSVGGTRFGKLNRIRSTTSNVFPVGCMGTVESPRAETPRMPVNENNSFAKPSPRPETVIEEVTSPREATSKRNPVTGEGVNSSDMPKASSSRRKLEQPKFIY
ncbi:hypothetical protein PPYR_00543 [Photinus pyralis]|uniref:Uncharacterized protein n=1 Tax=Photinus pyralis TaxID=7054 RepID=A0A1Y1M2J8_PHOPY|nr:uncharacterized protein LOC116159108 [Photinus pyralis]KAB0803573.1 hypothetical protein PPYR_00543 [Photinus pyralis]